jgi:redox-sensitive bicupin YhaK (pirin superfamily)
MLKPGAATSSVELVLKPRSRDLGGFSVRRVLPSSERQMIGPFIFFDHMGPVEFAPGEGIDVRPHPHVCLATVTYLFEGEIIHRDSLGHEQAIRPGAVNWMTAGRGIVHSERTAPERRRAKHRLHGIQSWVALPREHEEIEPSFVHHAAGTLPRIEQPGVRIVLIAGEAFGARSPVATLSETLYAEVDLMARASMRLPDGIEERGVYIVDGHLMVEGVEYEPGSLLAFAATAQPVIEARGATKLMLLGGAALPEKRLIWWNFVTSSEARMDRAKRDWKEGRFAKVPGEVEFIPLPE